MTPGWPERGLTPDESRDPYTLWDAAYVLGSLSSRERREFECHLEGCDSCRSAVAEVSGIPALLALLDRDEMAVGDGPAQDLPLQPEVPESLLTAVSRRRRRTRWLAVAVGTVAAVVVGVAVFVATGLVGVESNPPPQASGPMLEMSEVTPSALTATVALVPRGWGTEIDMSCTYADEGPEADDGDAAGDNLAIVAVGRDGSHTELATWKALPGVTAQPSAITSLLIDEITSVQVVSVDTGEVFLQRNL